eukprot:844922-Prymnesium_polylepis.1
MLTERHQPVLEPPSACVGEACALRSKELRWNMETEALSVGHARPYWWASQAALHVQAPGVVRSSP